MSEQTPESSSSRDSFDNQKPYLTSQQSAIVEFFASNPVTIVGAGAGAGKTYTIVQAVLDRLEQTETQIDEFILITFTRVAANELHARIEQALRNRAISPLQEGRSSSFWLTQLERLASAYIGTIHGFCSQLLRTYGYSLGIEREAAPYFASYLLTDAIRDAVDAYVNQERPLLLDPQFNWKHYELEKFIKNTYSQVANRGITMETLYRSTLNQPEDPGKEFREAMVGILQTVKAGYVSRKVDRHLLDGSDLIAGAAELLSGLEGREIAAKISIRYKYLIIDEFQDTDPAQGNIVNSLVPKLKGVLLVGDGKQAIYRFRGAVSLMEDMADIYTVPVLPLNQSRRPTEGLLQVQNALFNEIGKIPRFGFLAAPLEASEGTIISESNLKPLRYQQTTDGVAAVANVIRKLVGKLFDNPDRSSQGLRPAEPGDIVVLARTNAILDTYQIGLEAALKQDKIDVRVEDRGQFYRRPEIVATLRMLHLVTRYPNDTLLPMTFTGPFLKNIDVAHEQSRWLRFGQPPEGNPITEWFEENYPNEAARLNQLRRMARVDTVPQTITRLYRDFQIREYYSSIGDVQAVANLDKLRELARRLFRDEQALTLAQFVSFLQLKVETGTGEEDAEIPISDEASNKRPPYVRLMTVHGSKGREFPFVLIPEIDRELDKPTPSILLSEDGGLDIRLPIGRRNSITESPRFNRDARQEIQRQIEEEMRIFYVAITRAQHVVFLFGDGNQAASSDRGQSWLRYVDQAWRNLPPELVTKASGQKTTPSSLSERLRLSSLMFVLYSYL